MYLSFIVFSYVNSLIRVKNGVLIEISLIQKPEVPTLAGLQFTIDSGFCQTHMTAKWALPKSPKAWYTTLLLFRATSSNIWLQPTFLLSDQCSSRIDHLWQARFSLCSPHHQWWHFSWLSTSNFRKRMDFEELQRGAGFRLLKTTIPP